MSRLSRFLFSPFFKVVEKKEEPLIKYEDTVPFVFPITSGQVVKVYDGDTITIASKMPYENSPMYRFSVRLNGIDTPEIKGKTDDEKSMALEVRNKLSELIMNKRVFLKNVSTEKYGRILADVYLDDTIHINQWLIDNRYAVKYDGGTKCIPDSWAQYHLTGSNY
jgi:micrococcal nuclease